MSNTTGTSAILAPSGGGAQSGLGEKFSPDLFNGIGNFSVPIAVLAGKNGFFGAGWELGIPGITRKTV